MCVFVHPHMHTQESALGLKAGGEAQTGLSEKKCQPLRALKHAGGTDSVEQNDITRYVVEQSDTEEHAVEQG